MKTVAFRRREAIYRYETRSSRYGQVLIMRTVEALGRWQPMVVRHSQHEHCDNVSVATRCLLQYHRRRLARRVLKGRWSRRRHHLRSGRRRVGSSFVCCLEQQRNQASLGWLLDSLSSAVCDDTTAQHDDSCGHQRNRIDHTWPMVPISSVCRCTSENEGHHSREA